MAKKQINTVQETIPYEYAYKNGIIELKDDRFSKTYALEDIDTKTASPEDSKFIYDTFGKLVNTFEAGAVIQFTINNEKISKEEFEKLISCKLKGDMLDELREEQNQILRDKMREGRSNMRHSKYLTVSLKCDDYDASVMRFSRLDQEINSIIKKMSSGDTKPLTLNQRLELLHNILNRDNTKLIRTGKVGGVKLKSFDFDTLKKSGRKTKDAIAPSQLLFPKNKGYFRVNNKWGRVVYLQNVPNKLSWEMVSEIADLPLDTVTTLTLVSLDQAKAAKLVQRQLTKSKKDVMEAQKSAAKSGYSQDLIPENIKSAYEEADIKQQELTHGDQKLFITQLLVTIYADSEEQLEADTKTITSAVGKYMVGFKAADGMQELGWCDTLPLATKYSRTDHLWTTQEVSVFQPYSTKEISQVGGFYYGLHAVSRNMIIYNRKEGVNYNGVILGMSGTGKSFSAKREMLNVALNTDDVIYIIDPQGEYSPMMEYLGGEEIKIKPSSGIYVNPLDLDLDSTDDGDPITMKSDLVCSICDIVIGGNYGLTPIQKTVINRCVRLIYQNYMKYLQEQRQAGNMITSDVTKCPTLVDLYNCLLSQEEEEARQIAVALELYTSGSFDTFAHRTNVKAKSRIVSYNIKEMGENMRELGLTVCMNLVWNQLIENNKAGKMTWVYLDEFHLLTRLDTSAEFLRKLYKMARKWGGVMTGITQNVEDLLASEKARSIINNCSFVYLLSQSPNDRAALAQIYNISDEQLEYITNGGYGQGLIYNGKSIVPFQDEYPQDTKSYMAMTTKPADFEENM